VFEREDVQEGLRAQCSCKEDPMMNSLNDAHLLTVPEAATYLRIGRNLAYELIARGDLPAVRLGRVIRVPRTGLERWLEDEAASSGNSVDTPDERPRMQMPAEASPRRLL
jgi:excisionase family DNA binding protein